MQPLAKPKSPAENLSIAAKAHVAGVVILAVLAVGMFTLLAVDTNLDLTVSTVILVASFAVIISAVAINFSYVTNFQNRSLYHALITMNMLGVAVCSVACGFCIWAAWQRFSDDKGVTHWGTSDSTFLDIFAAFVVVAIVLLFCLLAVQIAAVVFAMQMQSGGVRAVRGYAAPRPYAGVPPRAYPAMQKAYPAGPYRGPPRPQYPALRAPYA